MKQKREVTRVQTDEKGLTDAEVRERQDAGQTNYVKKVIGKSYLAIFASNIFTFFNLLGILIFILMAFCGSFENMMFFVVILSNTLIGIIQEIRSKRAVEKLSLVQEPTVTVVRNGEKRQIASRDIVLDDVVAYVSGNQICADGVVISGEAEVNESLLTGESVAVKKKAGDTLLSGSFLTSGNCLCRCEKVGSDNYAEKLSAQVKKFKKPNSELMKGITGIIKAISWIVFPLGLATFLTSGGLTGGKLATGTELQAALKVSAGSMIGMIPSGMVLLTSVALAVSVIRLIKKHVLVRELYCIEMLSRVNCLCLDKTGTITDGTMTVEQVVTLKGGEKTDVDKVIASLLAATKDANLTAEALKKRFVSDDVYPSSVCLPFSSKRKFSAATLDVGTFVLGAAEFAVDKPTSEMKEVCDGFLRQGLRVLVLAQSDRPIEDDGVADTRPIAVIALSDTVRSDAAEIIDWFKRNDVAVKIISGDNALSVSVIAQKVGVENADKYISLEGLSEEEVTKAATEYTIFGRVTPEQKALLVKALKSAGMTVAMTGDGVNDILAMKESDCAVSVGCGSDAAKSVAQLVLTDNKFSSMPAVVAEGRRVVNNIQNSSSLFLMKTSMTICTTLLLLFLPQYRYPFQPQHLYAMEFFVIGITSFLLALKPNTSLITGKFIPNTLKRTLPSGLAMFLSVAMTYAFAGFLGIADDPQQLTTVAMFSMTATGVLALLILLYPYDKIDYALAVLTVVGTVACFFVFPVLLQWLNTTLLGKGAPDPMYVAIDTRCVWFIVINALAMAVIMLAGKIIMAKIEKKA